MRVALAQINPTSADIHGNAAKIVDAIGAATAARADLVVTPELALPGYCIGDLVEDTAFLEANERALQGIAAKARGITAVVGFIDCLAGETNDHGTIRKYNAAAVVRDGRVLQRARKSLLPSYRYFDDKRYFTPGERREPVDAGTGGPLSRLGVSICEDLWDEYYDVKPVPELVVQGANLVLNLNASPFYPGKRADPPATDSPSHRSPATARSSTSTRWAPPTTARTSSRSTARAWSTTPPGGSSPSAASSKKTCSSSISIRRPATRRCHCRRPTPCARSTTRW